MKLVKSRSPQNIQKSFNDKDTHNGIDIKEAVLKSSPKKEVELVKPISKEQAHVLWSIKTLPEKKTAIILILDTLNYMKHDRTIDAIQKAKKTDELDIIIANILLYSEEAAESVNKKRLEKANPFYISE